MQTLFHKDEICYDGSQLRSHWAYGLTRCAGDAIIAFVGPCLVKGEALVDLDDRRDGLFIESRRMVHFIVEHFDGNLELLVARQRLLVSLIGDVINEALDCHAVRRRGDDLYEHERKVTVSIATLSLVSGLIHTGVNVISDGAPVPAKGLADWGLDEEEFALSVLERYSAEIATMAHARCKVRGVI